jgi:SAM-dependent methyltransferase
MNSKFETEWRRRFEEFAVDQDSDAGIAGWSMVGLEARLRNFLRTWQPGAAGSVWLDAGCGAGTYARAMVTVRQEVIGLDYSLPSLLKARKRSETDSIVWLAADVTNLPLASDSCDGAICFGVLQALSNSERAIRELARVVRPGGRVLVDALNANCLPDIMKRLVAESRGREARVRFDSPAQLMQTFRQNGFRQVRLTWVPILPGRLEALQRSLESDPMRAMLARFPWLGSALSHAYVVTAEK